MRPTTPFIVAFTLTAALAGAQTLPKPPSPPQMPKAPALPAAPFAPDFEAELGKLDFDLQGLKTLDLSALEHQANVFALDASLAGLTAVGPVFDAIDIQDAVRGTGQIFAVGSSESADYDRGTSYLDSGRYDRAIEAFDKVIAKNGKKADGALYWKAYSQNRLGKRDEAIKAIEDLQKRFPSSRWINDSKALLIDVRQATGQPVSPDKAGDEELKLIALNSLMTRDPEKAIPMVEQMLSGSASPKLKERGLFVLAQSASPRARTLLGEMAKGKGNPDLQLKALDYLGTFSGGPDVPLLVDVYRTSGDIDVKKRVIRSLAATGRRGLAFTYGGDGYSNFELSGEVMEQAREALERSRADIERARADMEARVSAEVDRQRVTARTSGSSSSASSASASSGSSSAAKAERDKARQAKAKEASDALWQIYQTESTLELKREILSNLRFNSQSDRLVQIAKTDSSPVLRRAAIQAIASGRPADQKQQTGEMLLGLYKSEKDLDVRRQIVDSLQMHGDAATLVQMARAESDPSLKKRIVERLSMMKDKEAVDYMMELLKK